MRKVVKHLMKFIGENKEAEAFGIMLYKFSTSLWGSWASRPFSHLRIEDAVPFQSCIKLFLHIMHALIYIFRCCCCRRVLFYIDCLIFSLYSCIFYYFFLLTFSDYNLFYTIYCT